MITDNFGLLELLILAALAYAIYVAATTNNEKGQKNTLAAILIAVPAVLLLNSAGGSTAIFGADAASYPSGVVAGNFAVTEIIYVASILYGAWLLYKANQITAAIAATAAAVALLWSANDSTEVF